MHSKPRKIPTSFSLRLSVLTLAVLLVFSLACPVKAAVDLSMDFADALTVKPYTLGDIAAARLSAYGILEDSYRTPQSETGISLSAKDAANLLHRAFNVDPDIQFKGSRGSADLQQEFVSYLLQVLGYESIEPEKAVQYASEIGLQPVGLSEGFTLGDAALYTVEAAQMLADLEDTSVADIFGVENTVKQIPFPETILLNPSSKEGADAQVKEAIQYIPSKIRVSIEQMPEEDALQFYREYRGYEYQIRSRTYAADIWYGNITEPRFPIRVFLSDDERTSTNSVYAEKIGELNKKLNAGSITDDAYDYEQDLLTAEYCGVGSWIDLNPSYNEAWVLSCDSDEAFYAYEDSSVGAMADAFYEQYIANLTSPTEYNIVMAAKKAIMGNAEYDEPAGRNDGGVYYSDDAYSLEGFFEDGKIVCTGYSSVFQYLMTRAGIPCIEVFGATRSSKDAAAGETDHAWNKVKIGEKWYNIDICWADTGNTNRYDLKSDEDYQRMRHWGVYNWGGTYTAEENWK